MAWSRVYTPLLNEFIQQFNVHPYSFHQIDNGTIDYTPRVWTQQDRNKLADILYYEESMFNKWVGYNPYPKYGTEILKIESNRTYTTQTFTLSSSAKLQAFGTELKTLIDSDVSVVYANDKATVTVVTTELTDTSQSIDLYFRTIDGGSSDNTYKIPYLSLKYDTGLGAYVFVCHKYFFVKPSLMDETLDFPNGDYRTRYEIPDDITSFVEYVDVYVTSNDSTLQAELLFSDGTLPIPVTPVIINNEFSEFIVNAAESSITASPHSVKAYYLAGYPLLNNRIYPQFLENMLRRGKAGMPEPLDILQYTISTAYSTDLKTIPVDTVGLEMRNPIGIRNIDYVTWTLYKSHANQYFGDARYFIGIQ